MKKLYVVGIGPGGREHMTLQSLDVIKKSDAVVGYKPYIDYIEDLLEGKEVFATSMGGEIERVKHSLELANENKIVSIVSTGDAGLYGMAGPIYEMAREYKEVEIEVIPGITSAFTAASHLGAPLMQDTALISLSDLMNDWEMIKKRVKAASESDFCIALYNPKSRTRVTQIEEALDIIREYKSLDTPVGLVRNAGREGLNVIITTLKEVPTDEIDMMTTVIIGNKETKIENGKMVTPRGYNL